MESGDAGATVEDRKLSDLFADVWKAYQDVETSEEATNSEKTQKAVEKNILLLDLVSRSVAKLDLFSTNEEFDEIASADLKFFLLPALQAAFIAKRSTGMDGRLDVVTTATEYYRTFLQMCYDYGTGPLSAIKEVLVSSGSQIAANEHRMPGTGGGNAVRDVKIKKYKAAKQRDEEITLLKHHLEDDDTCRKYWKLQLDKWIDVAIDDIEMFQQEIIMLERFKDMAPPPPANNRPPPLKPFLLTRDKLQAAVYGAGYPSIPTVTLDEWFEKEAALGRMGQQNGGPPQQPDEDDKSEDEDNDIDNDAKIRKQREWDEFKDDHRRGEGNKKNKG